MMLSTRGLLIAVFGLLVMSPSGPRAEEAPAAPVSTVPAELKPVSQPLSFVGRVEAPARVEIRARVKGVLEAVLFQEGDTIKAGAPLYRIEKSLFEADVDQAQGALERSQAALQLATIQRQRAEELFAKNAGTAVERDRMVAMEAQAKGAVTSDEASLRTAQINLGYTDITAPVTGKIGRTALTQGNIVGPDSGVLSTIVSQDPMHITFPVSQRDLLAAQKAGKSPDVKSIQVRLKFADGSEYSEAGQINFVDVSVDRTTDTVIVRADIPNPKGTLIDGQLVKVQLQTGTPEQRVVVPQAALIADQGGVYVFVVEDGKAAVRRLKTGGSTGSGVVVESGLKPGEQVIVEGFQSLKPGMAVRATPFVGLQAGG